MKKLILILTFACGLMTLQAENVNLRKSVEDGIKTSIQHTENREWKEAFATCRALDGMINMEEQKTKKAAPELHYLVSKERLRMYMRLLNKQKECQEQLKKMEDWAEKAQSDEVSEDLLMTKAGYYQKFGMNDKSLQCYKELVQHRSKGKDEQGVDKCFQDMLAQAKENKNTSLSRALERLYTNWQDSIKAVKAAQELKALQDDYAASQNILAEKKSKISAQKGTIIFLCILVIALAGGLLFCSFPGKLWVLIPFAVLLWDGMISLAGGSFGYGLYAAGSKLAKSELTTCYISAFGVCRNGGIFLGALLGSLVFGLLATHYQGSELFYWYFWSILPLSVLLLIVSAVYRFMKSQAEK